MEFDWNYDNLNGSTILAICRQDFPAGNACKNLRNSVFYTQSCASGWVGRVTFLLFLKSGFAESKGPFHHRGRAL